MTEKAVGEWQRLTSPTLTVPERPLPLDNIHDIGTVECLQALVQLVQLVPRKYSFF